jgi:hypothetical protein
MTNVDDCVYIEKVLYTVKAIKKDGSFLLEDCFKGQIYVTEREIQNGEREGAKTFNIKNRCSYSLIDGSLLEKHT